MPELPDVELYCGKIAERVLGEPIEKLRLASPFLLRSVDPPASEVIGRRVTGVRRLGKRIVLALEGELFVVFHPNWHLDHVTNNRLYQVIRGELAKRGIPILDYSRSIPLSDEERVQPECDGHPNGKLNGWLAERIQDDLRAAGIS